MRREGRAAWCIAFLINRSLWESVGVAVWINANLRVLKGLAGEENLGEENNRRANVWQGKCQTFAWRRGKRSALVTLTISSRPFQGENSCNVMRAGVDCRDGDDGIGL